MQHEVVLFLNSLLWHALLQEGLKKIRKKLMVRLGSLQEPEPTPSASSPKSSSPKGRLFRKFFQTGNDDDDGSLSHQESMLDDRGVDPYELWFSVRKLPEPQTSRGQCRPDPCRVVWSKKLFCPDCNEEVPV